MQRSSQSIASLAGALAKAQSEIVNPEKSLIGTIEARAGRAGEAGAERVFRYASLAEGLEIVRKTLGQHEIATVQTTAIDNTAGIVNLTTVLAHSSGEWIASDWPVCAVSETATPHRMGAALTYARRYALFTLVGIAGEDDLDAPDLITPARQPATRSESRAGDKDRRGNGLDGRPSIRGTPPVKRINTPSKPMLQAKDSAAQRDQLLQELENLTSSEAAAAWAQHALATKNTLAAEDAQAVERAFGATLARLEVTATVAANARVPIGHDDTTADLDSTSTAIETSSVKHDGIDKSALSFPEPRRIRDKAHLKFVARQACLICGRRPCDPHHLRFAQAKALGRKASDEFTVPLCRAHHRDVHRSSDEASWWQKAAIDPVASARTLWLTSHPLPIPQTEAAATTKLAATDVDAPGLGGTPGGRSGNRANGTRRRITK